MGGSMPLRVVQVIAMVTCCSFAYAQMPAPSAAFRLQPGVPIGLPMQDASVDIGLHIVVLEGQNGINIVKKRAGVKPVVEVRDRTNQPVAGASVTFTAPNDDPSAVFLNGSRSETVVTDQTGQASVASMKPEGTGRFGLTVTASFQGDTATAAITQTNVMTAAEAAHTRAPGAPVATSPTSGLSNKAVIGIVAGVAAAAAVGIGVGLSGGRSSSSTGSVSVGTPTVGAPH
jgi:hypothetical protein